MVWAGVSSWGKYPRKDQHAFLLRSSFPLSKNMSDSLLSQFRSGAASGSSWAPEPSSPALPQAAWRVPPWGAESTGHQIQSIRDGETSRMLTLLVIMFSAVLKQSLVGDGFRASSLGRGRPPTCVAHSGRRRGIWEKSRRVPRPGRDRPSRGRQQGAAWCCHGTGLGRAGPRLLSVCHSERCPVSALAGGSAGWSVIPHTKKKMLQVRFPVAAHT